MRSATASMPATASVAASAATTAAASAALSRREGSAYKRDRHNDDRQ
jgi:hypothetical protein